MEKQYALRIYKTQNELLTVVTTRTGLIVNEAAGEVAYPVTTFEKQKNGKSRCIEETHRACPDGIRSGKRIRSSCHQR